MQPARGYVVTRDVDAGEKVRAGPIGRDPQTRDRTAKPNARGILEFARAAGHQNQTHGGSANSHARSADDVVDGLDWARGWVCSSCLAIQGQLGSHSTMAAGGHRGMGGGSQTGLCCAVRAAARSRTLALATRPPLPSRWRLIASFPAFAAVAKQTAHARTGLAGDRFSYSSYILYLGTYLLQSGRPASAGVVDILVPGTFGRVRKAAIRGR